MEAPSIDWRRVVGIWKQSGRTPATIALYACWARRFVAYCHARGTSPVECLQRLATLGVNAGQNTLQSIAQRFRRIAANNSHQSRERAGLRPESELTQTQRIQPLLAHVRK